MPVRFEFKEPKLMTWLLCHQCHNLISRCEEVQFSSNNITPEQHRVLMVIRYAKDPVKPTDIARWLDRRSHSISLIIERMLRRGIVDRIRDMPDRRSVRLVITKKGDEILNQANAAGWKLISELLSDFSGDDLQTLIRLMSKVREKAFTYLQPGDTMEEIKISEEPINNFISKSK